MLCSKGEETRDEPVFEELALVGATPGSGAEPLSTGLLSTELLSTESAAESLPVESVMESLFIGSAAEPLVEAKAGRPKSTRLTPSALLPVGSAAEQLAVGGAFALNCMLDPAIFSDTGVELSPPPLLLFPSALVPCS
jgi:hypothetical protein